MTTILALLVLIFGVVVPLSAQAEERSSFEAMLDRMDERTVPDASEALPESTVREVNVGVQWRLWQRAIDDGRPGLAELETLQHDAVGTGRPSLPYHQTAILHMTRQDQGLADDDVRRLIAKADELAPHLPYAQLELAHWHLDRELSALPRAVPPYIEGLKKNYRWLDTRIAGALKGLLILLIALGLAFVGFLFGQLLRYFGIAAYDGTRVLPRGFSSTQTVILLLALVLVPGLLLQSPLLSILLLLFLITPFQQLNERAVTACFLIVLAALPWLDDQMGRFVEYPGSDAQNLLHAHYHGCDEHCRSWLEDISNDAGGLALLVERIDTFRGAPRRDMEALEEWFSDFDSPRDPRLEAQWLNLEAAVLIANGKSDEAIEVLEEAIAADPEAAAPWFNKGRAYQILDDESAGTEALSRAFDLDLEATSRRLHFSRRDPDTFLMIGFVDTDLFWEDFGPESGGGSGLVEAIWVVTAGEKLDFKTAPWFGLAGLVLLLVGAPLRIAQKVSTPCPKCALARDPLDADETGHHHYCRPCYQTFVSGSSLDYQSRVHSEATLGRRDRLQSALRRLLSLLAPGVGHILGGHAIRGILATTCLATGVLLLLLPLGPTGTWRGAFELFRVDWLGHTILAWLLISIAASVGLTGLLRGVESTRVRSSSARRRDGE